MSSEDPQKSEEFVMGNKESFALEHIRQSMGDKRYNESFNDDGGKEFFAKITRNEAAVKELVARPQFIHELYEYQGEIFNDPQKFESFLKNSRERQQALDQRDADLLERLNREPFATEEELAAGVYKEQLEPQVCDAVFAIRRKGYGTFESGFHDLVEGSQYVSTPKGEFEKIVLPVDAIESLTAKGIHLSVNVSREDRDSIILHSNHDLGLSEWKEIWNEVAALLPDLGRQAAPGLNSLLIEKQEAMKAGKRVYLGAGLFFEKGKTTTRDIKTQ